MVAEPCSRGLRLLSGLRDLAMLVRLTRRRLLGQAPVAPSNAAMPLTDTMNVRMTSFGDW
jgi:hypothetical protein